MGGEVTTFVLGWFVSGVLGLLATSFFTDDDRLGFADLIHPAYVLVTAVLGFFLGPFSWLLYLAKKEGL